MLRMFAILTSCGFSLSVCVGEASASGPPPRDDRRVEQILVSMESYLLSADPHAFDHAGRGLAAPPSWKMLVPHGYLVPEMFYSMVLDRRNPAGGYSADNPEYFSIGRFALREVYEAEIDVIEAEAARVPVRGEWESIGDMVLSRSIRAITAGRSDLIVVYCKVAGQHMKHCVDDSAAFVMSDRTTVLVQVPINGGVSPEYEQLIAADRVAREELGLPAPPEYLSIIRKHTLSLEKIAVPKYWQQFCTRYRWEWFILLALGGLVVSVVWFVRKRAAAGRA